jgi:hypothetical protein
LAGERMSAPEFQDRYRLGSSGSARVSCAGKSVLVSRTVRTPFRRGARITKKSSLLLLGSAGCQPAAFGSLPNASAHSFPIHTNQGWRQAAANYRLAACAPQHPR